MLCDKHCFYTCKVHLREHGACGITVCRTVITEYRVSQRIPLKCPISGVRDYGFVNGKMSVGQIQNSRLCVEGHVPQRFALVLICR